MESERDAFTRAAQSHSFGHRRPTVPYARWRVRESAGRRHLRSLRGQQPTHDLRLRSDRLLECRGRQVGRSLDPGRIQQPELRDRDVHQHLADRADAGRRAQVYFSAGMVLASAITCRATCHQSPSYPCQRPSMESTLWQQRCSLHPATGARKITGSGQARSGSSDSPHPPQACCGTHRNPG
jgi:hypothetical protein